MHTQGQSINFINKVFGDYKSSNGGLNISVACPVCLSKGETPDKKKLVIRTDNWMLHCWKCSYKNRSIVPLIKTYHSESLKEFLDSFCGGVIPTSEDTYRPLEESLRLPEGFVLLAEQFDDPKNELAVKTKEYLISRGATRRDFWYYKFGITNTDKNYKYRVIIPSFDSEGELNYFTSRIIFSWFKTNKYKDARTKKESIIFNELNINWKKELTIVEGPFDLIKTNDNSTCLLGSKLDKNCELFRRIVFHETPVVLSLDNDAKVKQLKIAKALIEYGISVRLIEIPSHLNDVGEMTKKDFSIKLKEAKSFSFENDLKYRISLI